MSIIDAEVVFQKLQQQSGYISVVDELCSSQNEVLDEAGLRSNDA